MKRRLFFSGLIVFFSLVSNAQKVRLNGFAHYVFDDKAETIYENGNFFKTKITGGLQWGLSVEYVYPEDEQVGIELSYRRQDTKAPTTYSDPILGSDTADFDMGINWIMLGGNKYLRKEGSNLEGFAGLMAGAAIISADNPLKTSSSSVTRFAWGAKAGANIWVSKQFAIKLQAQLMSAVQSVGGEQYYGGSSVDSGPTVSSYTTMLQFGLGAGLTYSFK